MVLVITDPTVNAAGGRSLSWIVTSNVLSEVTLSVLSSPVAQLASAPLSRYPSICKKKFSLSATSVCSTTSSSHTSIGTETVHSVAAAVAAGMVTVLAPLIARSALSTPR